MESPSDDIKAQPRPMSDIPADLPSPDVPLHDTKAPILPDPVLSPSPSPSLTHAVDTPAATDDLADADAPAPSESRRSSSSLPPESHPTIAFLFPFPEPAHLPQKERHRLAVPPFVLYAPLAAALEKPAPGAKESVAHKAQRKWQAEEREAKQKGKGFKAKAVGLIAKGMSVTKNSRIEFLVRTPGKKKLRELRLFYPSNFPADDLQERFNALLKAAKSGAIKQGVIATSLLPFVLAFDVLTFVTGPFEINAVWAASSWTGAARATAITNGVTSSTIPLAFVPDARLDPVSYRLHEVCWNRAPRGLVPTPRHKAAAAPAPDTAKSDLEVDTDGKRAGEPGPGPSTPPAAVAPPVVVAKRGGELAALVLDVLKEQLGGDLSGVETDRRLVAEDLEKMLDKGAKEWVAALKAS